MERVPENVDAAKELLQYGLKGTDLEALIAIGNGEDGGRWVIPSINALSCIFHTSGPVFVSLHHICQLQYVSFPYRSPTRFIIPGDVDLDDVPYEDFLSQDKELERTKERESRRRGELLAKVDFSRYTGRQSMGSIIHCDTRRRQKSKQPESLLRF